MNPSAFLNPIVADYDWSELRFPGEATIRMEIETDELISDRLAPFERRPWVDPAIRFPERTFCKATSSISPALHRAVKTTEHVLRLEHSIELFVVSSGEWFVEPAGGFDSGPYRIALSSTCVSSLWARELIFLLGKSIAERLLDQRPMRTEPTFSPGSREALLGRGLKRFQELSSDRVGILACQSADAACRAVLKSTVGLGDPLLSPDFETLAREHRDAEEAIAEGDSGAFLSLRVDAIRRFARSIEYRSAFGSTFGSAQRSPFDSVPPADPSIQERTSVRRDDVEISANHENQELNVLPFQESPRPTVQRQIVVDPPEGFELFEPRVEHHAPLLHSKAIDDPFANAEPSTNGERVFDVDDSTPGSPITEFNDAPIANDSIEARRTASRLTSICVIWMALGKGHGFHSDFADIADVVDADLLEAIQSSPAERRVELLETLCRDEIERDRVGMASIDDSLRRRVFEEVGAIAGIDGAFRPNERKVFVAIGESLGLSVGEIEASIAEFADPEYADYPFVLGESIEVKLDGLWTPGEVAERIDGGDLRIRLEGRDKVLRFSPRIDSIRPAGVSQYRGA